MHACLPGRAMLLADASNQAQELGVGWILARGGLAGIDVIGARQQDGISIAGGGRLGGNHHEARQHGHQRQWHPLAEGQHRQPPRLVQAPDHAVHVLPATPEFALAPTLSL